MTAMYTKTVTMCKARHIRNYLSQEVGYNVEFQFDYNIDEVRATFSCSDDYADPALCHNDDDLTEYIIRRYGAFLIKENLSTPKNFAMDMKKIGEATTNPLLNKRDNYQDDYTKIVSSDEWQQLQQLGYKFEKRHQTSSYTKDVYEYRIGIWHG
jgi:hypothetical protein